jgi:hypothetical protein
MAPPGVLLRGKAYHATSWLFLRALGVVYLFAFWSLAAQVRGLIGEDGILPARLTMAAARAYVASQHLGVDRFRLLPTIAWLNTSDLFLAGLCFGGVALSVLLIAGLMPAFVLPLLWFDYLSLSVVSRDFLSYQWDALLLETGFLAIFLAPLVLRERLSADAEPPLLARWLLRWLLFRLMAGSGAIKLASGDSMWRGLTALSVHFETQPIPTPIAWYAHHMPLWLGKASTAAVIGIELLAPFLMFGRPRERRIGFALLAGLQLVIFLTGNYAFFNLLTVALCVWLLDDEIVGRLFLDPATSVVPERPLGPVAAYAMHTRQALLVLVAIVTIPVSALIFASSLGVAPPGASLVSPAADFIAPFRSVNSYGLFAVMTPTRPEIIVEGSDDGEKWFAYEFKYKPGDTQRRPPWVAPHQPRLDWQMWFAALEGYERAPWFSNFCLRLLQGSPEVLRLMAGNPFPKRPPRYVRGILYRYRFTDRSPPDPQGAWWTRELLGAYSPPLSLDVGRGRTPPAR